MMVGGSLSAHAETLSEAAVFAMNNHPVVESALAERDLAGEEEREKKSDFFPEVSINAATGRVYGDNSTSRGLSATRGVGYSWNHEGGLTVNQLIFDGQETVNRVDAADARRQAANVNIMDVQESLALRVVLAYLDVLRNRESAAMIREHAGKIANYRKRIGKMVDQGAADESMAVQTHDIQNQLDGTLADIEGQMNKALAEYAEAVGHPADSAMAKPSLDEKLLPADVEDAVVLARKNNPALKIAALQGIAAGHDIDAERATLYPDVSGELSYFKKDLADVIGGEVVDERALLRMNWTFSTGGAQLARIRQSVYREAATRARNEDLANRLEREVRKAYAEMDASKSRLDVSRDRVDVSDDLVKTYKKQFEAAKITLLNLLQAENAHFNAKLGVLNADYRHMAAEYSILASTGRLQDALNVKPAGVHE
ncbi:MAG TPA: TolC family protein [Micavibrio sp.]